MPEWDHKRVRGKDAEIRQNTQDEVKCRTAVAGILSQSADRTAVLVS